MHLGLAIGTHTRVDNRKAGTTAKVEQLPKKGICYQYLKYIYVALLVVIITALKLSKIVRNVTR